MGEGPPGRLAPRPAGRATATRKLTRSAAIGHQIATEIMLQRVLQAVLGFVRPEARAELLRLIREATEHSVGTIDLGEVGATEEAKQAAALAVASTFDPLEAEVARSRPVPTAARN